MTVYCRLGSSVWSWDEWTVLDPTTRLLWLALYSSAEAKRLVPGLWHGSIHAMADASRLPPDDVVTSLNRLRERELADYDTKLRVLRLVRLPDAGEAPSSGNVIRGWFTKFKGVPQCAVRDAHIETLRWLLDEWSRESGKPISVNHEEAWNETFGDPNKIWVSSKRRSRPVDAQTDLFEAPKASPKGSPADPEAGSDRNSNAERQVNDFTVPERVTGTVSQTLPEGGDLRSRSRSRSDGSGSPSVSDSVSASGDPETTPRANLLKLVPLPPIDLAADLRRTLVNGFAGRVNAARTRVAEKLAIAGQVRPVALQGGEQTLVERLRESQDPEGDLAHVLEIAEAEALAGAELRWLSWSLAEPKAWRTKLSATLSEVQHPKRRDTKPNAFAIADAFFDDLIAKEKQTT